MVSDDKTQIENSVRKNNWLNSNRTFLVGLGIWWTIFIIFPLILFAILGDWITALSLNAKIGIGFIGLSCILLGATGTRKVVNIGGVNAPVDYEPEAEDDVELPGKKQSVDYWEILLMGRVWMLLWGFIYLIPLAFGVPFII